MLASFLMNNSFQKCLEGEFKAYTQKSDRLSLRSFAKKLGLAPSTVHQYLSGKYFPSEKNLKKIGQALNWSDLEMSNFLLSAGNYVGSGRDWEVLDLSLDLTFPFSELVFKVMSLRDLGPLKANINSLASKLKISKKQTPELNEILKVLNDRELIRWDGRTLVFNKKVKFVIQSTPSGEFLEFQKKSIDHFKNSLVGIPKDERLVLMSSIFVNVEDLPKIAKDLNLFVANLKAKYSSTDDGGQLYQIVNGLVPIE